MFQEPSFKLFFDIISESEQTPSDKFYFYFYNVFLLNMKHKPFSNKTL